MMSNKFDIRILHNNFDILREIKHLNKGEFCELIKISNAYRRDQSTIGLKMLKGITDNFQGIDEEWLLTSHDVKNEVLKIKEQQSLYSKITNDSSSTISDPLLTKADLILKSPTVYSTALRSNIEAFHYAITCEGKLTLANKRIDNLEEQILEIKDRLPAVGE
jgi:competence CoiA-like predicted nuclease